jgi:malate dehydrogenase (oxaloacetate-decarboxylating)
MPSLVYLLLARLAVAITRSRLAAQRVVMLGAGSAATGIAEPIVAAMVLDGLAEETARSAIWLVDRDGLVHTGRRNVDDTKRLYAQPWNGVARQLAERIPTSKMS